MKIGVDSFAYFNIDYDGEGRKNQTLEVCVHPNGKYAVSVIGARGGVKCNKANSFDGVLDKRSVFFSFCGKPELNKLKNLLADLNVNYYKFQSLFIDDRGRVIV